MGLDCRRTGETAISPDALPIDRRGRKMVDWRGEPREPEYADTHRPVFLMLPSTDHATDWNIPSDALERALPKDRRLVGCGRRRLRRKGLREGRRGA